MPDKDKLLKAINAAEAKSYGSDSEGDLSTERATLIDHYLGVNTEPAPDGRSQVTDRSVYETIQWICPSLSRIFANGDDVVDLPPVGPEDEKGAKQESQYLNYLVLQKNNWFQLFDIAAKDALLTKAAYLYVYREKRTQLEAEKYERQTQEGVSFIINGGAEITSMEEYPDPDYQPQPMMDPITGQPAIGPDGMPMMAPPPMLYDLEVRRTKEQVQYCIEALPPERCKVSESLQETQLVNAPYFEYDDYTTISQLRQDGYDIADDIQSSGEYPDAEEETSRDQYGEDPEDDHTVDPAMRRVKARYVWIRHDYDEDGVSELQYCIVIGSEIIYREECNEIPVAVICPDPLPHRHIGLCPADAIVDIQRIKTAILRQGLDNLYLSNNPRTYINPSMVNLDDFLVSRPGGVVRGKGVFGQDIMPFETPFVFDKAMAGLEYMDQVRENRTGTNRYFTGIDQNALNKTATGIQQLSSMAAQRVEQIARQFANGIERMFSILHALVLKGGHKADVVKLRGQWVQVDPATWKSRTDFKISVGFAAGNKDLMVNRLMLLANLQKEAIMGGLPIVTPQNLYETAIELTKASDFATPERFWTEPSKAPTPQPPQPDVTVMAAEQIRAQTSVQTEQIQAQIDKYEADTRAEMEKYKADLDAQVKVSIANANAQHTQALENVKAMNAAGLKRLEGESAASLEERKASLNPKFVETKNQEGFIRQFMDSQAQQNEQMRALFGQIMQAIAGLNGRKRVVRGRDGRVEGVEPVN